MDGIRIAGSRKSCFNDHQRTRKRTGTSRREGNCKNRNVPRSRPNRKHDKGVVQNLILELREFIQNSGLLLRSGLENQKRKRGLEEVGEILASSIQFESSCSKNVDVKVLIGSCNMGPKLLSNRNCPSLLENRLVVSKSDRNSYIFQFYRL